MVVVSPMHIKLGEAETLITGPSRAITTAVVPEEQPNELVPPTE